MKAKKWGFCPACASVIGPGEDITKSQGRIVHTPCVPKMIRLASQMGRSELNKLYEPNPVRARARGTRTKNRDVFGIRER